MPPVGDAAALASVLGDLLDHPERRAVLAERASKVVAGYDWPVVAQRVLEVYATAIDATTGLVTEDEDALEHRLFPPEA